MSLITLLLTAPKNAIPPAHSRAYHLLRLLADGKEIKRNDLVKDPVIGELLRAPLQALMGEKHQYWNIRTRRATRNSLATIRLDQRHLSNDKSLDAKARIERKATFRSLSLEQAKLGRIRESKAINEYVKAREELFVSLGLTSNGELLK